MRRAREQRGHGESRWLCSSVGRAGLHGEGMGE